MSKNPFLKSDEQKLKEAEALKERFSSYLGQSVKRRPNDVNRPQKMAWWPVAVGALLGALVLVVLIRLQ